MLSDQLCLESGLVRRLGAQVPFLNGFLLFIAAIAASFRR
jgi:hypothetical protein